MIHQPYQWGSNSNLPLDYYKQHAIQLKQEYPNSTLSEIMYYETLKQLNQKEK